MVKNDTGRRFYYNYLPEIANHQFIECALINMWYIRINIAWVSFANCAAIYLNTHKAITHKIPESWKFKDKLDGKMSVYTALEVTVSIFSSYSLVRLKIGRASCRERVSSPV